MDKFVISHCGSNPKQRLSLRLVRHPAETKRSGVRQSPACGSNILKAKRHNALDVGRLGGRPTAGLEGNKVANAFFAQRVYPYC